MARKKATKKSKPLTSDEIASKLEIKFDPPEWALFFEVRSAVGDGIQRYADAIGMTTYPSKGLKIHGFEFKSNRSDLLGELKDVSKSAAIQKYCDHWWLVLGRKDLICAGELPSAWGLIVPYGSGLQIAVKAPVLKPCDLNRPFVASLLRSAKRKELSEMAEHKIEKEAYARGHKDGHDGATWELQHLKQDVEEFEKASGIKIAEAWNLEKIGVATKFIVESGVGRVNAQLESYLTAVRRTADSIEKKLLELRENAAAEIKAP